jgi:drug/metabolite transporter (DMT)-like permease
MLSASAAAFLLAFVAITTARQFAFKAAAILGKGLARSLLFGAAVLSAPLEMLVWIAFLAFVPLGQGVLAGCIAIVAVLAGGRIVFGERLTPPRLAAALLITLGVALAAGDH